LNSNRMNSTKLFPSAMLQSWKETMLFPAEVRWTELLLMRKRERFGSSRFS
jgi:hypothetical protein